MRNDSFFSDLDEKVRGHGQTPQKAAPLVPVNYLLKGTSAGLGTHAVMGCFNKTDVQNRLHKSLNDQ